MINPVAFEIFGIEIYWYGITYVIGFLFAYFFIMHYSKYLGFKKDNIEDAFFYVTILSLIGARIFEIIFYNPMYYASSPIKVFYVWEGGMSIHGGILGGLIALKFYSINKKVDFLRLTDLFVVPLSLLLAFGRLANFVNHELVGVVTNSSLGVVFNKHDEQLRWPVQIFAGFKNLVTFEILYFLYEFKKLPKGFITALFLILYSFGRFFIDFLRVPTTDLGIISLGQLLCLVYGFVGIILLIRLYRFKISPSFKVGLNFKR
jgi:phosphatidylglycerol:prolipoprotein diacylglycerol transferase